MQTCFSLLLPFSTIFLNLLIDVRCCYKQDIKQTFGSGWNVFVAILVLEICTKTLETLLQFTCNSLH